MANYPKKMIDPTEAALSAIQEALNIRDDEEQTQGRPDWTGEVLLPTLMTIASTLRLRCRRR